MRFLPLIILLYVAVPAWAQGPLVQDFRGGNFDEELLIYSGQTPEKYLSREKEGLRIRFPGNGETPVKKVAGVGWRQLHARGDFVVSARYEILLNEQPNFGQSNGIEMYLRLKNVNKDAANFSRVVSMSGASILQFNYITNDERGDRILDPQHSKRVRTTEASLRGAFQVAREGNSLVASFAEGADGLFQEFQRMPFTNADIDLIRISAVAGGDSNAALDLRILEFRLAGKDLSFQGRNFATPAPMAAPGKDVAAPQAKAPEAAPPVAPGPVDGKTPTKWKPLVLIAILFLLIVPILFLAALALYMRSRKSQPTAPAPTDRMKPAAKKSSAKWKSSTGPISD